MEEISLLRDLAVVMAVGGAVTALFHRLGQPVVLGYILAGFLIGPAAAGLVSDPRSIETLAALGVILLLFSMGLEFSLRKLRRVGGVAVFAAALEIPLMISVGYTVGALFGWDLIDRLFLGAIVSISSTTIIVKTLMDLGRAHEEFARIILGILIVEDLAVIVILVLLSGLATAGTVAPADLFSALGGVLLFVTSVIVVGLLAVPRMIDRLAVLPVRDVATVSVLGLCFGVAILGAEFGFSVALGAFLIGVVIAEARHAERVHERIEPIRDMFTAMFFVAVGLQIEPAAIIDHWLIVLVLSVIVIVGKFVTCSFGTLAAGHAPSTALLVGLGLGQIGEFSFVMANVGRSAGVVSPSLYSITIAVSLVTTLTTPYRLRYADAIAAVVARWTPEVLGEFLTYYDGKIRDRFRRGGPGWRIPEEARLPAIRAVLSAILLLALLVATNFVARRLAVRVAEPVFFPHDAEILVWSVGGVASFPLIFGLWRTGGELAAALSRRLSGGSHGNRALTEAIRFTFTVIGAVFFLVVASPVFPTGVPMLITAGVVGIAAVLLWRSILTVQTEAEHALADLFASTAGEGRPQGRQAEGELQSLISRKYRFDVVVEDIILPFTPTAANRAIGEIGLRSRTGATIAAIYRDEKPIVNPGPEVVLQPGDLVLLLGSREQVERAMRYLSGLER